MLSGKRISKPLAPVLLERLDRIEVSLAAYRAWALAPGVWDVSCFGCEKGLSFATPSPFSTLRVDAASFAPASGDGYMDELFPPSKAQSNHVSPQMNERFPQAESFTVSGVPSDLVETTIQDPDGGTQLEHVSDVP